MSIKDQVREDVRAFLDGVSRRRTMQLSRNALLRRGLFRSEEDWKEMRRTHPAKLKRINQALST